MAFVIGGGCVDVMDRSCLDHCPVDCIYEGPRKLYIHPDECIDCGACEPACPQDAIFFDTSAPDEQRAHIEANRAFFDGVGSPGGASGVDVPLGPDRIPGE
ncbi:ferredoxin [Streptomyces sp. bgisy027]|uniref:ferredoxin n=1 Tax=unclassified Streptomyces TaxID=2593676 RepID=UPI003D718EC5